MRLPVSQLGRTVLCSWLKIRLETWPPQLCWAQPPPKGTAELRGCLNHSALFSSDTFPWPLSTAQQPHLSINRHASPETVLPKDTAFRPQPCPHSTSSYLLSCQHIPCSLFFIDFLHPLKARVTCLTSRNCHIRPQWHRHAISPPPPSIEHSLGLWAFAQSHPATEAPIHQLYAQLVLPILRDADKLLLLQNFPLSLSLSLLHPSRDVVPISTSHLASI